MIINAKSNSLQLKAIHYLDKEYNINSLYIRTKDLFSYDILQKTIENRHIQNKCLLILDSKGTKQITQYMTVSDVINQGIFTLESLYHKRKPYKKFDAIYIIGANEKSMSLILKDFKRRKNYKKCHIFFVEKISRKKLEFLLHKSLLNCLCTCKELNINYEIHSDDENLFYFSSHQNYNPLYFIYQALNCTAEEIKENKFILFMLKLTIDKLYSVCKTMNTYPNIIYLTKDAKCKYIAEKLNKKLKKYFNNEKNMNAKRGTLLLTSRLLDLCAPLQYSLIYSYLINEFYKKSNSNNEKKNFKYDFIYRQYRGSNLDELLNELSNDLAIINKNKIEENNNASIEMINNIYKNINDIKNINSTYKKHMEIIETINKNLNSINIMRLLELQRCIISGQTIKGKKSKLKRLKLNEIFIPDNFNKNVLVKILCLLNYYFYNNDGTVINEELNNLFTEYNLNELDKKFIYFFINKNSKIDIDLLNNLDKVILLERKQMISDKINFTKNLTQEEKDNENDKRYLCIKESKLTTLIHLAIRDKLPKDLFEYLEEPQNLDNFNKIKNVNVLGDKIDLTDSINNSNNIFNNKNNIIVFNLGGLSVYEIASIEKEISLNQFDMNVIYGSNMIYTSKQYLKLLKNYFDGEDGIVYEDSDSENENINESNDNNENEESQNEEKQNDDDNEENIITTKNKKKKIKKLCNIKQEQDIEVQDEIIKSNKNDKSDKIIEMECLSNKNETENNQDNIINIEKEITNKDHQKNKINKKKKNEKNLNDLDSNKEKLLDNSDENDFK